MSCIMAARLIWGRSGGTSLSASLSREGSTEGGREGGEGGREGGRDTNYVMWTSKRSHRQA